MTTATETVRVMPAEASAYGPVEITWYPDHLEITALGAGDTSIADAHVSDGDVVVEIRAETVPGAD